MEFPMARKRLSLREFTTGARTLLGILTPRYALSGPRSVALSLANICNTNCIMCDCHSPLLHDHPELVNIPETPFMDSALFERIIRESRAMGAYRVVLAGFGDPSLHPDFDRMLEVMMQLDMEPYVLTNGLALDDKRVAIWAGIRAHFRFSLHAGDVETWLRVHPGGTVRQYERLSRAIKTLAASGVPRVSAMHVIHKHNFDHVREMVEHAREHGLRSILFRPVRAQGPLAPVVLGPQEQEQLRRDLAVCLPLAESYGIHTNLREYLESNLLIAEGALQTSDLYRKIPCYIGWIYAEFDPDGTLRPCIFSQLEMGRMGETRLRDIWHSPRYQSFRREARTMPQRGRLVKGCRCHACCMTKYNINMYNLLHLKSLKYTDA
jgi:MoaA/NifB/PqqE/SkfB family radical SAM enzyme